jgi:Nif-specific regulatory protein
MKDEVVCRTPNCSFSKRGPSLEFLQNATEVNCRSVQELCILFGISRTLEKSIDLTDIMLPVLRKMQDLMGLERGTITLINRDTNRLKISEAVGIPRGLSSDAYLELIQPHLQKVVDTRDPVIISKFGDWVKANYPRAEFSIPEGVGFLCVPMKFEDEVIGTLSIERQHEHLKEWESDVRLMCMIASIIAQAAYLRQETAEQINSLREENDRLHEKIEARFRPENIIGNSNSMRTVYYHIEQVASSANTTVLIRGESGTGKELAAKALHENSPRKNKPFVKFNCAALPDSIIESELFGHEKGAFTGALAMRKGRFEVASGGTIFLDEIGDVSPQTQVKLLRVLQEKEFERVGSQQTLKTDVRIIAATSRNLEEMIMAGTFREDLYYRLNVFPIYMPPLRERKSDILLLADHFIEKYSDKVRSKLPRISSAAIDMLMSYYWPGNVRELENCVERAVLLAKGQSIKAHHLPPTLLKKTRAESNNQATLEDSIQALERELIVDALKDAKGNMTEASRRLGITERKMGLRVSKYALDLTHFK